MTIREEIDKLACLLSDKFRFLIEKDSNLLGKLIADKKTTEDVRQFDTDVWYTIRTYYWNKMLIYYGLEVYHCDSEYRKAAKIYEDIVIQIDSVLSELQKIEKLSEEVTT